MLRLIPFLICAVTVVACERGYQLDEKLKSKQVLPLPYSNWMDIETLKSGQALIATKAYKWTNGGGARVFISPVGEIDLFDNLSETLSGENFGPIAHEKLYGVVKDRFVGKLDNLFGVKSNASEVYHLRIFGNKVSLFTTTYLGYDLFIYASNGIAEHIYVCIDYCNSSSGKLITTEHSL